MALVMGNYIFEIPLLFQKHFVKPLMKWNWRNLEKNQKIWRKVFHSWLQSKMQNHRSLFSELFWSVNRVWFSSHILKFHLQRNVTALHLENPCQKRLNSGVLTNFVLPTLVLDSIVCAFEGQQCRPFLAQGRPFLEVGCDNPARVCFSPTTFTCSRWGA